MLNARWQGQIRIFWWGGKIINDYRVKVRITNYRPKLGGHWNHRYHRSAPERVWFGRHENRSTKRKFRKCLWPVPWYVELPWASQDKR